MTLTVHKYPVPIPLSDWFHLDLPSGARVLAVQMQYGHPMIWVLVDPTLPLTRRVFRLAGTGHPIDLVPEQRLEYVGTFQIDGGALIFHIFERYDP